MGLLVTALTKETYFNKRFKNSHTNWPNIKKRTFHQKLQMQVTAMKPDRFKLKVAFFQKVRFVFQTSKSSKKIFQKTILNLKFKFHANSSILKLAGNLNFKSRIVFRNNFFFEIWRFEKRIALYENKATFSNLLTWHDLAWQ